MRQKLCRRLEDLEKISAAATARRAADSRDSGSAIDEIRAILHANNFPQQPVESLAETFARYLGISSRELRQKLMELASGRRAAA